MSTDQREPAPTDTAAVRVEGLTKSYRSGLGRRTRALDDCDIELPAGSVTALVGANGAGKTTLLSLLAGLLTPDSGRVGVAGRVRLVAQAKPVYRRLRPRGMLAMAADTNTVFDHDRARAWLERFEVPDRGCGQLSGGQRTQVALAVAVGACPDVLLLDEPLAELDPLVRREVTAELLRQGAERDMTIVLATHIVTELDGVADRMVLLGAGRVLLAGAIDSLLDAHVRYTAPAEATGTPPGPVVHSERTRDGAHVLARRPSEGDPGVAAPWTAAPPTLDDLVRGHLAGRRSTGGS